MPRDKSFGRGYVQHVVWLGRLGWREWPLNSQKAEGYDKNDKWAVVDISFSEKGRVSEN